MTDTFRKPKVIILFQELCRFLRERGQNHGALPVSFVNNSLIFFYNVNTE